MRRLLRPVFCAALFCLYPALVQAAAESEILGLFQRWQAAHGQRSGKALEGVYAPRLDYYGRAQTRERTLSAKQAFFARHPDFEQRIVAAPQIVPGDQEGRYEVRFVKQVRLDGRLRNYPGCSWPSAPGRAIPGASSARATRSPATPSTRGTPRWLAAASPVPRRTSPG